VIAATERNVNARDLERTLLEHCAIASRTEATAHDMCDANVFRLAAMALQSRFPAEAAHLMQASERYFIQHPNEKVPAADVVRNGWIASLPRLRDMLSRELAAR
jgi:hypothetical protein